MGTDSQFRVAHFIRCTNGLGEIGCQSPFFSTLLNKFQSFANFTDWNIFPIPADVFDSSKRPALHPVDIQAPVQVIDFVLQNARKPTFSVQTARLSVRVQIFDNDAARTLHQCAESCHAQASFKELGSVFGLADDSRIYQDEELHRLPFPFGEDRRVHCFKIFRAIFNHGQLEWQADLRRGESNAWRIPHRIAHVLDQLLNGCEHNLFGRQRTRFLTEDGFPGLHNFESHRSNVNVETFENPLTTGAGGAFYFSHGRACGA
jgi:hypothetical protein